MHQLIPAFPSQEFWNGITTTSDGRIFVCFDRARDDNKPRIAEVSLNKHIVPYPDTDWNIISPERELLYSFVNIISLRLGNDGRLWILDRGCLEEGCMVRDSAKLVEIDLMSDSVRSVIALNEVLNENSELRDMRISKSHIFISDVGRAGLIVVDSLSGTGYRVSTSDIEGNDPDHTTYSKDPELKKEAINSLGGQLELSGDGLHLFHFTHTGNFRQYEISNLLKQSFIHQGLNESILPSGPPELGPVSRDLAGNVFLIDKGKSNIVQVSADGQRSVLLQDKLLAHAQCMWIDNEDFMWITSGKDGDESKSIVGDQSIRFPVYLFKLNP